MKKKDKREEFADRWFPAKAKPLAEGKTPKGHELAAGSMLHSKGKEDRTILVCFSCKKPLWIIWPLTILSPFSTEQKPATPIGHKWSLEERTKRDAPSFECPLCHGNFAKLNEKLNTAQYLTDKGLI